MKKLLKLTLLFTLVFSFMNISHAVVPVNAQAKDGFELIKAQISLDDILNQDRGQIEKKIGKKLKFKDRIALNIAKKRMKRALKKGKSKKEVKKSLAAGDFDFNVGGFFLGLLLGLIGVLIAYIFMEQAGIKSAWIGFGVLVILILLSFGLRG